MFQKIITMYNQLININIYCCFEANWIKIDMIKNLIHNTVVSVLNMYQNSLIIFDDDNHCITLLMIV
jgi:hypothetical protein